MKYYFVVAQKGGLTNPEWRRSSKTPTPALSINAFDMPY